MSSVDVDQNNEEKVRKDRFHLFLECLSVKLFFKNEAGCDARVCLAPLLSFLCHFPVNLGNAVQKVHCLSIVLLN